MLKWLLTLILALVVLTLCSPWFGKFGLGRLPGDVRLRFHGKSYYLPITTTVLVSLALTLITRVI